MKTYCTVTNQVTTKIQDLTPADEGVIAVTMGECQDRDMGDDDTISQVYFALVFEADLGHLDATVYAYQAVHGEVATQVHGWRA